MKHLSQTRDSPKEYFHLLVYLFENLGAFSLFHWTGLEFSQLLKIQQFLWWVLTNTIQLEGQALKPVISKIFDGSRTHQLNIFELASLIYLYLLIN